MPKMCLRPGLCFGLHWGSLMRFSDLLAGFQGLLLKGGNGRGFAGEGKGGEGVGGEWGL